MPNAPIYDPASVAFRSAKERSFAERKTTEISCPHPMAVDERWFRALVAAQASWWDDEDDEDEDSDDPTADIAVRDGVALVPIHGLITKRGRFWWMSAFSSDDAGIVLRSLVEDRDDVKAIVLDVDSGGGECFGTASLSDTIYGLRGSKPIVACVNELVASAAYWIASAADEIVIASSGYAGSIGVYSLHVDYSAAEAERGIKTTVTFAGKFKAIHERPLVGELAAYEQAKVDETYRQFIEAVARNRNTTPQDVLERMADARVFIGQQAVDAGLCDRLGTLAELVGELATPKLSFSGGAFNGQTNRITAGHRHARRVVRRS